MTPSAMVVPLSGVRHHDAWKRWSALCANAPPYLAPEFFSLSQPFSDGGEPVLAEAWDERGLVGALPLAFSAHSLNALRGDQTPGFDYWGDPKGLDAIWHSLAHDRRWDVMTLRNVPVDSLLATRLPELARADGCKVTVTPGARHLYLELPGFEARLSSKFATNLRRCGRKAGGVELERLTTPSRSDFEAALAIEAMAWKGAAGTSIGSDPRVAHFYQAMTRLFGRRGHASLCFLRAGGQRIALLLSVEDDETLYALKIGYDPAFYAVSPGQLMVWQVARDAEARGLLRFDFVGHEDEWKRKWTDRVHEQVFVTVYRHSPRGLALHALREVVKPRLPEPMRDLSSPLRRSCQRLDLVGQHSLVERARGRIDDGLGIRSGIKRVLRPPPPRPPVEPLGAESRFAVGSWVRVLDEARVRATLDAQDRLRGLAFVPSQWPTCGQVYRVAKHVRRMRDDQRRMRPISRTVLLENVSCAGVGPEPAGCGRHCPMMYRDEWLEAAEAPRREPPAASTARHARVRDIEEIRAGLDLHGRRDGLTFMPEMAEYCRRRVRIAARLPKVFELDAWIEPRSPIYILEGANCSGASAGKAGPCHRSCALLWHEDWLVLEPEGKS